MYIYYIIIYIYIISIYVYFIIYTIYTYIDIHVFFLLVNFCCALLWGSYIYCGIFWICNVVFYDLIMESFSNLAATTHFDNKHGWFSNKWPNLMSPVVCPESFPVIYGQKSTLPESIQPQLRFVWDWGLHGFTTGLPHILCKYHVVLSIHIYIYKYIYIYIITYNISILWFHCDKMIFKSNTVYSVHLQTKSHRRSIC